MWTSLDAEDYLLNVRTNRETFSSNEYDSIRVIDLEITQTMSTSHPQTTSASSILCNECVMCVQRVLVHAPNWLALFCGMFSLQMTAKRVVRPSLDQISSSLG